MEGAAKGFSAEKIKRKSEEKTGSCLAGMLLTLGFYIFIFSAAGADIPIYGVLICAVSALILGVLNNKISAVLSILMALLWDTWIFLPHSAKVGGMIFANGLFEKSESLNKYIYSYFEVPEGGSMAVFAVLTAIGAAAFCRLAVYAESGALVGLAVFAAAVFQIYFGVTASAPATVLFFSAAAALCVYFRRGTRGFICSFALCLAAGLLIASLWGGPNAKIEEFSEDIRDRLAIAAGSAEAPEIQEDQEDITETHKQNRLDKEMLGEGLGFMGRGFEKIEQYIKNLARPESFDFLKTALMMILILMVLCLPFAPFMLMERQRKKAFRMREGFGGQPREAVRRIFPFIIKWLETQGGLSENALYIEAVEDSDNMPEGYRQRLEKAFDIWSRAEFSDLEIDEKDREEMLELLDFTEKYIYGRADGKKKFRLKYIDCLALQR